MPLYPDARSLIRANLEAIQSGQRVNLIAIGTLTDAQLIVINAERRAAGHPEICAEVVFLGRHTYNSRALTDGYSIEDILDQIASGMDSDSVVCPPRRMTMMENPNPRADRYGNKVNDRVVLECSARYPRPELFSVIPKGDVNKPNKKPLTDGERLVPERLVRVTISSGTLAASEDSIAPRRSAVNDVLASKDDCT